MNIKSAQKKLFRGFTLIELLVVIAIIGVLASAVLVAINPGKRTRQAQDAKRKNDIGALATELQGYYTTPGAGCYPATLTVLVTENYLKQMPTDPVTGADYSFDKPAAVGTCTGGTAPEVAIWATIAEPVTAGMVWCWQSTDGKAEEQTAATCALP